MTGNTYILGGVGLACALPLFCIMGKYIQQNDLEDVFGQDNILIWSNLDNEGDTADTARIARAIAFAEEEIENRFRCGRYAVPFAGLTGSIPRVVIDWAAKLAGIWLYECRPQKISQAGEENIEDISFARMRRQVERDIHQYASGQRNLALVIAESDNPSGPVVI